LVAADLVYVLGPLVGGRDRRRAVVCGAADSRMVAVAKVVHIFLDIAMFSICRFYYAMMLLLIDW
jgi:hypothetical protein